MEKLVVDCPFLLGFDLSNANGYHEYQDFMNAVLSGEEKIYGFRFKILRRK